MKMLMYCYSSDSVYRWLFHLGYNPRDSPVDGQSERIGDIMFLIPLLFTQRSLLKGLTLCLFRFSLLSEGAVASADTSEIAIDPNLVSAPVPFVCGHGFKGRWRPTKDPYFFDQPRRKKAGD